MQTHGSNQVILMKIKDCYRCQIPLEVSVIDIQDTSLKSFLKEENSQFWTPVLLIHKPHSKLNIIYFKSMFHACYTSWYKVYEGLILCFRRLWIWERLSLFEKFWGRRSSGLHPLLSLASMNRNQNRNTLRN